MATSNLVLAEEVEGVSQNDQMVKGSTSAFYATHATSWPAQVAGRVFWRNLPHVIDSGILKTITPSQLNLQEALFEVIASERSYCKNLQLLDSHFLKSTEFSDVHSENAVINSVEWKELFAFVKPVKEASERFLAALEERWRSSVIIPNIGDIVLEHAEQHFHVYVKYCSNQVYQERCLTRLQHTRTGFSETLKKLESDPICLNQNLHAFLLFPVQRITRFPLLIQAILKYHQNSSLETNVYEKALEAITKIVQKCNDRAMEIARNEQMLIVSNQLEFRDIPSTPIFKPWRYLIKKGEVSRNSTGMISTTESTRSSLRRLIKTPIWLFLFNDLLIIAKKTNEDRYSVLTYCDKNLIVIYDGDEEILSCGLQYAFQLCMLSNHKQLTEEILLCCANEEEKKYWVQNLEEQTRTGTGNHDICYEEWNCPLVVCMYSYKEQQQDELSLETNDVMKLLRCSSDGWHFGKRIRDGTKGWFPGTYTVEIPSAYHEAKLRRKNYRIDRAQAHKQRKLQQFNERRRSQFFVEYT